MKKKKKKKKKKMRQLNVMELLQVECFNQSIINDTKKDNI